MSQVPIREPMYQRPGILSKVWTKFFEQLIKNSLPSFDIDPSTPSNGVYRIRHSDTNFIANAGFEHWYDGTTSAPSAWNLQGTATIARSAIALQGNYSAEITFGAASDGELYAVFGANTYVDYTYSVYVTKISGSGGARMIAQKDFSPYTEEKSIELNGNGNTNLATLTFMPTANGNYRINFKATGSLGSVWRIDEVKVQESKGIATTWTAAEINDSFPQNIYGLKYFYAGIRAILPVYANNAAAVAGGLSVGEFYRTGADPDLVCIVHA